MTAKELIALHNLQGFMTRARDAGQRGVRLLSPQERILFEQVEDAKRQRDHDQRRQRGQDAGMSPSPAHRLADRARRPGLDRLAFEKTIQFLGQRPGRGIPSRRRFFEALQADRFEIGRNVRFQPARGGRFGLHHVTQRGQRRGPAERRPAGQQFVEHRAERIDVAGRADVAMPAGGLLRRHVAGTAHDDARLRQPAVVFHDLGQAEVGDPRLIGGVDEHVLRLQVAMQGATLMGEVDRLGDDLDVARRDLRRQRPVLHEGPEVATGHVVHREVMLAVMLADLVDGDDVGVLQVGGGFGLAQESLRPRPGWPGRRRGSF